MFFRASLCLEIFTRFCSSNATTPHKLNATDWRVYNTLKQLCRTTPLVLSAALYAAHAERNKATITCALRKLERAGLVEREGHGTRTVGWRVVLDAAAAPMAALPQAA
jgi:predicted transcriptional regulator